MQKEEKCGKKEVLPLQATDKEKALLALIPGVASVFKDILYVSKRKCFNKPTFKQQCRLSHKTPS